MYPARVKVGGLVSNEDGGDKTDTLTLSLMTPFPTGIYTCITDDTVPNRNIHVSLMTPFPTGID